MDKILVIGGAGFIGSKLVRQLLEDGNRVVVLDKFLYGRSSLEGIKDDNLHIIEGDTRHIETITEAIKGVDAVVQLAELVGDPACDIDPKITNDINYLATHMIAFACRQHKIQRFIYISSCSVYGASGEGILLNEDAELKPVSLYAKVKLATETFLLRMKNKDFHPVILRLGTVFGMSPRPRFDLVVNLLTAQALKEGNITIFQGEQWRPNVHVYDVSKAIIASLKAPSGLVSGEIFNVGSTDMNFQIKQIGEKIKEFLPETIINVQESSEDKRDYRVNFQKIYKVLGYETQHSLAEGIQEIIQFFKTNDINYKEDRFSNVRFLRKNMENFTK